MPGKSKEQTSTRMGTTSNRIDPSPITPPKNRPFFSPKHATMLTQFQRLAPLRKTFATGWLGERASERATLPQGLGVRAKEQ